MTTGDLIKKHRLQKGLTAQKAADLYGVRIRRWWEIEAGKHTPRQENLRKIAPIVGCKIADLIPDENISVGPV